MAETDFYAQNLTLHTFNSEKFPQTSLSTNIFPFEDNHKNIRMSKVSIRLSKTPINQHQAEEKEQIEMEKNLFQSKSSIKVSKFSPNLNVTGSILLPNEVIINVVVKDTNENILLKKIFLQLNEDDKVMHIIRESILQFNKLFEYERILIKLSTHDLALYNLKPSKKNGLPNYDMPAINNEINILDAKINSFSLVFNNAVVTFANVNANKTSNGQVSQNSMSSDGISCVVCKNCILM